MNPLFRNRYQAPYLPVSGNISKIADQPIHPRHPAIKQNILILNISKVLLDPFLTLILSLFLFLSQPLFFSYSLLSPCHFLIPYLAPVFFLFLSQPLSFLHLCHLWFCVAIVLQHCHLSGHFLVKFLVSISFLTARNYLLTFVFKISVKACISFPLRADSAPI